MADFKTHVAVASVASGLLASCALEAGAATRGEALVYAALGAAGGMLPDVDLDHSTPARVLFAFLAALLAFVALFSQAARLSLPELLALWTAVFLAVRHGPLRWIERWTVHRGLFHSLAAAACSGLLATAAGYRLLGAAPMQAWLAGVFVGFGYVVHLVLDELYSVDLTNVRIKRSFGTALKPLGLKSWGWSALLVAGTFAAYLLTPPAAELLELLRDPQTAEAVQRKLWPRGVGED
jgi:hypothetical protein